MKRLLIALFLLALAVPAGAGAARPKVLAIHFVQDVNPVTQDWLNGQLDRAQNGHYDAAVATQAASLLQAAGRDPRSATLARLLKGSTEPVRRGFAAYAATLPEK